MYCKDCKHWSRNEEYSHGFCDSDKLIDVSDYEGETYQKDTLEYRDCEQYGASFSTGENFGCIHFEKR